VKTAPAATFEEVHMKHRAFAALGLAGLMASPVAAQDEVSTSTGPALGADSDLSSLVARAVLADAEGGRAGTAEFRQLPGGLLITVQLENMTEGAHGIHIHETGACTPDLSSANGHFAPEGRDHGFAATETPHAGDLPNIHVGSDGRATASFLNTRASLSGGETAILDTDDAALIVHAEPDDYQSASSAGDRVACGVIRPE
jgi:Cu-Zn family superoxide dismutase